VGSSSAISVRFMMARASSPNSNGENSNPLTPTRKPFGRLVVSKDCRYSFSEETMTGRFEPCRAIGVRMRFCTLPKGSM
jgi:hypothetical protein